jgi:uncharacterized phage-associated protein
MMRPHDPRALGNLILDEADRFGHHVSNLSLQKLMYFCHGLYLVEMGQPLVKGYFEAWTHGPVHPGAYEAFKSAGRDPITFRAQKTNPVTGEHKQLEPINDPECGTIVSRVVAAYGGLSSGRLVELSHAPNGPWAKVVENSRTRPILGLRITDNIIRDRFRFHKVSVGSVPRLGDPSEDAPFA